MRGHKRIRELEQEYEILYRENMDEDIRECVKIFRILLLVTAVFSACFFFVSLPLEKYHLISFPYAFLAVWHLGLFLIICKREPTIKHAPVFYIFNLVSTAILAFAGLFAPKGLIGYGIIIMLIFIPMVVPGSYKHVFIYEYVIAILYIAIIHVTLSRDVFYETLLMVIIFATLGWIMGLFIQRLRLQGLELRRQMELQRSIDQVTGIKNRRMLFEQLLTDAYNDIQGIAMIDIDDFKQYNDTYGHVEGDRCLRKVGNLMTDYGLENNVGFYRYGGEEFVALIYGENADVTQVMQGFNKAVAGLKIKHEPSKLGILTVSIGVVRTSPAEKGDFEKVITQADNAMYDSKRTGKNKTIEYKKESL